MKLIIELIEFAIQRDMLTEEHKRKLQDGGLYAFNEEGEDNCSLEDCQKLTEDFPRLLALWDSWKAGKLERVLADGFTINDVYALINVELPKFQDFSGPPPTAFRQQIFEEVRELYETDREMFGALSCQNGKLNFPSTENAVQTYTTSMKVWTILNLPSKPVTPERIEEVLTWKTELAIAMLINLDYITELAQRDWSSLTVITECAIEKTILKSVIIPKGVTEIENEAFCRCDSLTTVVIPEGVKEIGESAFDFCTSLTSVALPVGLKKIGECAFYGCDSLKSVLIPEGVTEIGCNAFRVCSCLTSVALPKGVTEIGHCTFWGCRTLTSVNIPDGVKKIGDYAFSDCYSLTSVTLPEGLKEIGDDAFWNCSSLTSVALPKGLKWIGWCAFCGCDSLTTVVIPKGVAWIGECAFCECSSLTSVTIPAEVMIMIGAFDDCPNLTIHAPAGSYAEHHARGNNIPFQPLEEHPVEEDK